MKWTEELTLTEVLQAIRGLLLLGEEKISVERKKGSRYAITTKRNGSKEN